MTQWRMVSGRLPVIDGNPRTTYERRSVGGNLVVQHQYSELKFLDLRQIAGVDTQGMDGSTGANVWFEPGDAPEWVPHPGGFCYLTLRPECERFQPRYLQRWEVPLGLGKIR